MFDSVIHPDDPPPHHHHLPPHSGPGITQQFSDHMQVWLGRLESQISAGVPDPEKQPFPELQSLFRWVDGLMEGANRMYSNRKEDGLAFAEQAHAALIAAFVVGRYLPPVRLSILRSLIHPDFAGKPIGVSGRTFSCQDPDCKKGPFCKGNRLTRTELENGKVEWHLFAPHHKNDRRGTSKTIVVQLPEGPLTILLRRFARNGRVGYHQLACACFVSFFQYM